MPSVRRCRLVSVMGALALLYVTSPAQAGFELQLTSAAGGNATFTITFAPGKIEDVKFVSGDEKLKSMTTQIANSKLRANFPDTSPARLTRRGVLVCGSSGCDFTLLLPSAPYSTEAVP